MSSRFPVAYWGSVAYYQKLLSAEERYWEIHETYQKQSIRNRCRILSANGVLDLSIPIVKPQGSKTLTKDIRLVDGKPWRLEHWRALSSAYASSPYFEHYGPEVQELLERKPIHLIDYLQPMHEKLCSWLDLPIEIQQTKEFRRDYSEDHLKSFKERLLDTGPVYTQVFREKEAFEADLSMLDALFNLGPMARTLLLG